MRHPLLVLTHVPLLKVPARAVNVHGHLHQGRARRIALIRSTATPLLPPTRRQKDGAGDGTRGRGGRGRTSTRGCTDFAPSRAVRRVSGDRLCEEAQRARSNEDLVRRFIDACRRTRTNPADALVDAERQIEARIAERVPPGLRRELEHLLDETVDSDVTRFVWLRQFEPGSNSAAANRLLDRLEHLQYLDFPGGPLP